MSAPFAIHPRRPPVLDKGFVPASLWNRAYRQAVRQSGRSEKLVICLERSDGSVSAYPTEIFPHSDRWIDVNVRYVERLLKFLLWAQSGCRIVIAGNPALAASLSRIYSANGERRFDYRIMGQRIYGRDLVIHACGIEAAPTPREVEMSVGRNLEGCRIGFDLGGSDRKCAAVVDGKVVFSEEITWAPYFQKDPRWHKKEINDSLRRAAGNLPRVDAIGGSAAGVYFDNRVCFASLFRGVSDRDFDTHVRDMFLDIREEWGRVPMVVVNDGKVAALAGAMAIGDNAVMGIAMGTCLAAGYVTPSGNLTNWMNDLSFAPVDYRADAPVDEWSGDRGCGVQYFSQQAVARLAPTAGIRFPEIMPLPERLRRVQDLMAGGDERATDIYRTIGAYFGYAMAHYAELYTIRHVLVMGRVTSGPGGEVIMREAECVLMQEFPDLASAIRFHMPDEKMKRHGQAVTAACLPTIAKAREEPS